MQNCSEQHETLWVTDIYSFHKVVGGQKLPQPKSVTNLLSLDIDDKAKISWHFRIPKAVIMHCKNGVYIYRQLTWFSQIKMISLHTVKKVTLFSYIITVHSQLINALLNALLLYIFLLSLVIHLLLKYSLKFLNIWVPPPPWCLSLAIIPS